MNFPYFATRGVSRDYMTKLYGYNRSEACQEGEFFDQKNISSDSFPALSPRRKRTLAKNLGSGKIKAILAKDGLCYVYENTLYVNDELVTDFPVNPILDQNGKELPITMLSMGAYVIIFPQNLYVNTLDLRDKGHLEEKFQTGYPLIASLGDKSGNLLKRIEKEGKYFYPETPEEAKDNDFDFYVKTEEEKSQFFKYVDEIDQWVENNDVFIVLSTLTPALRAGELFESRFPKGSNITVRGFGNDAIDGDHIVYAYYREDKAGYDSISFRGVIPRQITSKDDCIVERLLPKMDFVVESQNRLWGCRYGEDRNGKFVNEIYASELGNPKNWFKFEGVSSDSYAAGVGTDGAFTAAAVFQGNPVFFKENCFHKVYGTLPANYQIQTHFAPGVEIGSSQSVADVNGVLIYKSADGIYVYDGTFPTKISDPLGKTKYKNAVGGSLLGKYYVSMKDDAGDSHLFVFDTKIGIWNKEDNASISSFAESGAYLYFADEDGKLWKISSLETETDRDIEWMAETGRFGLDSPDMKYIARLHVRLQLSPGARAHFMIEYDSGGIWESINVLEGRTIQSFTMPLRLRRCDHFRLRIKGKGDVKIYSISKSIIQGRETK